MATTEDVSMIAMLQSNVTSNNIVAAPVPETNSTLGESATFLAEYPTTYAADGLDWMPDDLWLQFPAL